MPCNIGYRSASRAKIKAPQPETLRSETTAPSVDAELLERLGQTDPQFAEWLQELDIGPLLIEALVRTLNEISDTNGISFTISDAGRLVTETTVRNAREKKRAQATIDRVATRWQMEVIGIAAELIDYETMITGTGDTLILEGEKRGDSKVSEYVRVVLDPNEGSEICFEHFTDPDELQAEELRFLALMQRLGVDVIISSAERHGQPIPVGTVHRDFLKQRS